MNVNIICVGKLKEKYLKEAESEYLKRISRFAKVKIIELNDEKLTGNSSLDILAKNKEGENIINKIPKNSYIFAMDIKGKQSTSIDFAKELNDLSISGKSDFTFIIGGSLGLSEEVLKRANKKMSFSLMTFPHQLFRVMLLEQIYRCFKINNNETYHK
ncbi:23S rRNA (pseudouridine(1915)-N(3))-methyltransferase RlmH [Anaerofustis stercorihominis]|uniref:Ribosomal RNA large subunit methyltransferase H n=2 Tax=Anaerofustis stercorihominis TaxID=214853 RepID=B1C9P4_9FIRM|nr:23S rRNA (pseudouridine(1915)-N(3))-methyltransferase RlmH [Anaerofustis stercorihominis]EDS72110.1 rRNA large subunit m3Psi methyltransferase RlmH [Anaerofustis stercorihominis DSM 17244]MCQ4795832.1 23S rRNA (pseudouridine(1915)-N(3))-methyltransferase RlmH [Anaerofustis stercorihominis]RGD75817.1 23S rRNA (pseudouridine(1915)-N(3))-methyltransferase RlmH [Anaerofustis stercorihominis]